MPTKKPINIKIDDPLLVKPYSPVYVPFPVPDITDVCDEPRAIVEFNCALIPYILGALEIWVWEDSFVGTLAQRNYAKGLFKDLQVVFGMAQKNCGCDDKVVTGTRINPETGQIEQSTDGGTTWQPTPNNPYSSAVSVPPLPGANGDTKKCKAANNIIDEMKRLTAVYGGYIGVLQTIFEIEKAIILEAATMLFIALGAEAIADALSTLISKAFDTAQALTHLSEAEWLAMFTEEKWDIARCILVCHGHDDGVYTQADWNAIRADMKEQLGATTYEMGASLETTVYIWGLVGLNNAAATGQDSTTGCDDCPCGNCSNLDNWTVVYGNVIFDEPGHWTINSGDAGSGNQAVRIANYAQGLSGGCCTISYDTHSAGIQNMARYECGSPDAVPGLIPQSICGYDFAWTNIFGVGFTIDIYFVECPS